MVATRAVVTDGTDVDSNDTFEALVDILPVLPVFVLLSDGEELQQTSSGNVSKHDPVADDVSDGASKEAPTQSCNNVMQPEGDMQTGPNENLSTKVTRTKLPTFSSYVECRLKAKDADARIDQIWSRVVDECARHYLATCPGLASSAEYQEIGRLMVMEYPSLARQGLCKEWTLFSRSLSQRVRHLRWLSKKKTTTKDNNQEATTSLVVESAAKRPRHEDDPPQDPPPEAMISDDEWKRHLKETAAEFSKAKPNVAHILRLLDTCHPRNLKWFSTMEDGVMEPIMKCLPCFEESTYLLLSFKTMFGAERYAEVARSVDPFMEAVEELSGERIEGPMRMYGALKYIEGVTSFTKGKGLKSKSIFKLVQDPDADANINKHLKSNSKAPPSIVTFMDAEGKEPKGSFIVFDRCSVNVNGKSTACGVIVLIAAYYVFSLEYPKIYSQVLGLLQTYLVKDTPYRGVKTAGYIKLATKIHAKILEIKK